MVNRVHTVPGNMATEEEATEKPPVDEVMEDIRRELVRELAKADRNRHRDIYDALEDE